MENNNEIKDPQNGSALPSIGATTRKGEAINERAEINEGDASKQRPEFGGDAGPNTSSREDQLPSLNDGGLPGADAANKEEDNDDLEEQKKGSDADVDRGGDTSI